MRRGWGEVPFPDLFRGFVPNVWAFLSALARLTFIIVPRALLAVAGFVASLLGTSFNQSITDMSGDVPVAMLGSLASLLAAGIGFRFGQNRITRRPALGGSTEPMLATRGSRPGKRPHGTHLRAPRTSRWSWPCRGGTRLWQRQSGRTCIPCLAE